MACLRERRGKWVVDWRDLSRRRRWRSFPLTDEGRAQAEQTLAWLNAGEGIDPLLTLKDYIARFWWPAIQRKVEANTAASYEHNLRLYVPASIGELPLKQIKRAHLKRLLAGLAPERGLAEATVSKMAVALRSVFKMALDDEVIEQDPSRGLAPALGLRTFSIEKMRAMTGEQLETFLDTAQALEPRHYAEFATLAYTGIRIGELRGLQIDDLDLEGRTLKIERQVLESGLVMGPKGRRGKRRTRTVDVADDLAVVLQQHLAIRRAYDLRINRRSPWLLYPDFHPTAPTQAEVSTETHRLRRAMRRVLKAAKLPHFTPHAFRHTLARLLLERGEDLLYVARQLGDTFPIASEIYGKWARVPGHRGGTNLLSRRR